MKKKRKLSPGDTCVFYNNAYRYHGTVVRLYSGGKLQVRSTNGNEYDVHEKQCRFPKPKKAPAAPMRERVERWQWVSNRPDDPECWGSAWNSERAAISANGTIGKPGNMLIHLVELKPGEKPINRADLAKAWPGPAVPYPLFEQLCEALGLEEREP